MLGPAAARTRQEQAELTRVALPEQPGSHAGMAVAALVEVAEGEVAWPVVVMRYVLQNLEANLVTWECWILRRQLSGLQFWILPDLMVMGAGVGDFGLEVVVATEEGLLALEVVVGLIAEEVDDVDVGVKAVI